MRVIALDPGTKRIGVAVSDPLGMIANPWGFIEAADPAEALRKIGELVSSLSVEAIVVGLPKNMNGTLGAQAEASEKLASTLRQELGIPVHLVDERMTSKQAEGILIEAGMRRKKRKLVTDKLAATIILQTFLDSRKSGREI